MSTTNDFLLNEFSGYAIDLSLVLLLLGYIVMKEFVQEILCMMTAHQALYKKKD